MAAGPAGELKRCPDTLAAIWGLLLRGGGGEGREGKGEPPTTLSGYAMRGGIEGQGWEMEEGRGEEGNPGLLPSASRGDHRPCSHPLLGLKYDHNERCNLHSAHNRDFKIRHHEVSVILYDDDASCSKIYSKYNYR